MVNDYNIETRYDDAKFSHIFLCNIRYTIADIALNIHIMQSIKHVFFLISEKNLSFSHLLPQDQVFKFVEPNKTSDAT